MSKPSTKDDLEETQNNIIGAQAAADSDKALMGQSAQRFGNSYQFQNGNGSAAAMDSRKSRQTEDETTLGELKRKYGF